MVSVLVPFALGDAGEALRGLNLFAAPTAPSKPGGPEPGLEMGLVSLSGFKPSAESAGVFRESAGSGLDALPTNKYQPQSNKLVNHIHMQMHNKGGKCQCYKPSKVVLPIPSEESVVTGGEDGDPVEDRMPGEVGDAPPRAPSDGEAARLLLSAASTGEAAELAPTDESNLTCFLLLLLLALADAAAEDADEFCIILRLLVALFIDAVDVVGELGDRFFAAPSTGGLRAPPPRVFLAFSSLYTFL